MKIKFKDIYINYKVIGTSGPWIIFLHGWAGSIESFEIVANNFAKTHRCLIVDFPPFGKSEEPYEAWNVDTYKDMTMHIINYLGIEKFSIVAHSFGGRVAIKIASDYNKKVSKLLLIDSAGIKPKFNLKKFAAIKIYKIKKRLGIKNLPSGSKDYQGLSPLMKKTFINVISQDLKPCLKSINCDTLIINGSQDLETPLYMAKTLNKNIKDSALIVFDGCGHFCYLDDYQKFIAIAQSFLKG